MRGGKRGSDDAPHDDASGDTPADPDRVASTARSSQRSHIKDAVMIAVAGAVATVVTTALLSGATWSSVAGWFGGDDSSSDRPEAADTTTGSPTSTSAPSSVAPTMKVLTSADGAIRFSVPDTWGSVDAGWNLDFDGTIDSGVALRSGVAGGVTSNESYDAETYYLGASSATAERLGLPGRNEVELRGYLTTLVRYFDWTLDGCSLEDDGELDIDGYVVVFRTWSGCAGFTRMTMWEVYGSSTAGDVFLSAQLQSGTMTEDVQRDMLTTWILRPELLPSGHARRVDDGFDFPTPPWYRS